MPFSREQRKIYYKVYNQNPIHKQENLKRQKLKYWRDKFIILFPNIEYKDLTIYQLKRACKIRYPKK